MTAPVFDAARNQRVLDMLNNTFAWLYIQPWLSHADLSEIIALWHHVQASKPRPVQLDLGAIVEEKRKETTP